MKKRVWIYCAALVVLLSVLVLIVFAMFGSVQDAGWYAEYVSRNESELVQLSQGELQPEQSLRIRCMLARGRVEWIYIDEGRTCFHLKNNMLEGHVCLVYAPEGNVPTCLDFCDNWALEEENNGVRKWTGGMYGKAYIILYDLGNNFYLEEAYLPT